MHDVVIIGGGHNGLVCSAYLAMAGFKVVVLDQRHVVGGAAVTEEFSPGFANSVPSYTVSLLNPKVIRDLDLNAHGLRIVERPLANFLPLDDGRFLKVGGDQTKREVAKFSTHDADRLDDYQARLAAVAEVLRAVVLETPPNVVEGASITAIAQLIKLGRMGNRIRALGLDLQRDLLDLFTSVRRRLARRLVRERADQGRCSASTASSATMPAPTRRARPMCCCTSVRRGERQEGRLGPRHRRHGRHHPGHGEGLPRARRRDRLDAPVAEVLVERGRAVGVVTDAGAKRSAPMRRRLELNPKLLFERLVDAADLPAGFPRAHGGLPLRLGHLPHERRAVGAAATSPACPARGAEHHDGRHHHRAEASTTWSAPIIDARRFGWSKAADRRDADPVDPRRHAWRRRAARGEPVLPAVRAGSCRTARHGTISARRSPT